MGQITVTGTGVYDGAYVFDEKLTNGEYHRIYLLSGTPGGRLGTAVNEGNVGAICALAAIVLERHGKDVDFQMLLDSTETPILEDDPVEVDDDALPPTRGADETSESDGKTVSSGHSGSNGSGSSASVQSGTGQGSSAPSVTSGQAT